MATIEVRDLDEETIRCLQRRAAFNERTVEEEARAILGSVSATMRDLDDQRAEFDAWYREEARKSIARRKKPSHPPSEVMIREARDARAGYVWPNEPGR